MVFLLSLFAVSIDNRRDGWEGRRGEVGRDGVGWDGMGWGGWQVAWGGRDTP